MNKSFRVVKTIKYVGQIDLFYTGGLWDAIIYTLNEEKREYKNQGIKGLTFVHCPPELFRPSIIDVESPNANPTLNAQLKKLPRVCITFTNNIVAVLTEHKKDTHSKKKYALTLKNQFLGDLAKF